MAFWNRDDGGEWEKYQKSGKDGGLEKAKKPLFSDEFKAYYKSVRFGLPEEKSGYATQPGEQETPLKTFLSRLRRDKPEKAEEPEEPPEKCPWCGGDMVKGYLTGGRDSVYWRSKMPRFFGISGTAVSIVNEGDFLSYKTVWHCGVCRKMMLDTLTLEPPLGLGRPDSYSLSQDGQAGAAEYGACGKEVRPESGGEIETEET